MLSDLLMGFIARVLPDSWTDGLERSLTLDRHRRLWVNGGPFTQHQAVDDGSFFIGTGAAIGTGQTWVAAQIAYSSAAPNFYFYNAESDGDAKARTIELHFLKMIATAAATGATAIHYAFVLDPNPRAFTTDNMTTYVVPYSPGSKKSPPIGFAGASTQSGSIIKVQNSATASAIAAPSNQARTVARGVLGGLNIVGDRMQINFGTLDVGVQPATTAVEGAGQPGARGDCESGVAIPPGWNLCGHIWAPGSSASFNPEFVLGVRIK